MVLDSGQPKMITPSYKPTVCNIFRSAPLQNILSAVASNSSHGRPSHQCGWNFLSSLSLFRDLHEGSAPSLYLKNGIMSFSAVFCKNYLYRYYKPNRAAEPEIFTHPIPILQAPDFGLVLSFEDWSLGDYSVPILKFYTVPVRLYDAINFLSQKALLNRHLSFFLPRKDDVISQLRHSYTKDPLCVMRLI